MIFIHLAPTPDVPLLRPRGGEHIIRQRRQCIANQRTSLCSEGVKESWLHDDRGRWGWRLAPFQSTVELGSRMANVALLNMGHRQEKEVERVELAAAVRETFFEHRNCPCILPCTVQGDAQSVAIHKHVRGKENGFAGQPHGPIGVARMARAVRQRPGARVELFGVWPGQGRDKQSGGLGRIMLAQLLMDLAF